jgi:hypothetical protein
MPSTGILVNLTQPNKNSWNWKYVKTATTTQSEKIEQRIHWWWNNIKWSSKLNFEIPKRVEGKNGEKEFWGK